MSSQDTEEVTALRRNLLVGGIVTRKSFLHSFGLVMCGGAYGYCCSPSHTHDVKEEGEVKSVSVRRPSSVFSIEECKQTLVYECDSP